MRVNTIEFNYDTTNSYNLPLNLRYNYSREIDLPEYSFKIKRNCPVCYSSDNVNDELIIKVSFEDENKSFNEMYLDIRGFAYNESKNILGTTQTHKVGFINGYSQGGSINFKLKSNKINNFSAGKFDCCYKWQYKKEESETWTDFDITEHTVYIIPHTSLSKPWEIDNLSSNYVPWADALDFVCSELNCFSETVSDDEISEHIAKWINRGNFVYDNDGECNYSSITDGIGGTLYPIFNANKFLGDYSKASSSNKLSVNCNDCACINTFFLSLLGITNEVSYISSDINFSVGFSCNEVISIGNTEWHVPFYNESEGVGIFSYHAVCGYEKGTSITDSCLKIDFGDNPWSMGDPSGASKKGEVACKTAFADPATNPDNLPKTPYVSRFYRERLCDMAALTANLCKVVSTSEDFEFTTMIYKFHMVGRKLINKHLKMYFNDFLNKDNIDKEEKFYSFDSINLNNELKISTSFINAEKNFCELIPESEEYKDISVEMYLCDDLKMALSCLDSLVFDNTGGFVPDNELSVDCNIAMKSLSGKIITAVKENIAVKVKSKNNVEILTKFTKEFLSLFD